MQTAAKRVPESCGSAPGVALAGGVPRGFPGEGCVGVMGEKLGDYPTPNGLRWLREAVLLQPGCQNDSSPISRVVGDGKDVPGRPLRGLVMSRVAFRKQYFTRSANVRVARLESPFC